MDLRRLHPLSWLVAGPLAALVLGSRLPRLPFGPLRGLGVPLMLAGLGARLWCEQVLTHAGTSADPEEPPRALVQQGPYGFSRNPMMVGALLILGGATLASGSPTLAFYTLGWLSAVDRYLREVEEPELQERFGSEYEAYSAQVSRWLPGLP